MNSTMSEFFYSMEYDETTLDDLVCVAGINVAGTGLYTEPLPLSRACKCMGVVLQVCLCSVPLSSVTSGGY